MFLTNDLKAVIANNISQLRKKAKFTQMEFAEKLNYSDKAVSKWERGESVPDITVLKSIADIFGVTVDYLITEHTNDDEYEKAAAETAIIAEEKTEKRKTYNRAIITGLAILAVWLVATMVFAISNLVKPIPEALLVFCYGLPVSCLPWLVLNSCWFNRHRNYLIISIFMWTTLLSIFISMLVFNVPIYNAWLLFIMGIPGQAVITTWSFIRKHERQKKNTDSETDSTGEKA